MTLPTTRPSDELTTAVVSKQFQNEEMYTDFCVGRYGLQESCVVCIRTKDSELVFFDEDPRDCTNTALKLLHWVIDQKPCAWYYSPGGWWYELYSDDEPGLPAETRPVCIPISGPPFCYAVVHLAARVLGEGEG